MSGVNAVVLDPACPMAIGTARSGSSISPSAFGCRYFRVLFPTTHKPGGLHAMLRAYDGWLLSVEDGHDEITARKWNEFCFDPHPNTNRFDRCAYDSAG
jgi:hypothetical protein